MNSICKELIKGTPSYLSGVMAKLTPESVKVEIQEECRFQQVRSLPPI